MTANPDELLGDLRTIRQRARADRHAYAVPLLVFAVIETLAGLARYDWQVPGSTDGRALASWAQSWAQQADFPLLVFTTCAGALTVWWYRQHADRVGLSTRVSPLWFALGGGSALAVLLGMVPVSIALWFLVHNGTTWLMVPVFVLVTLAFMERSPFLWIVASLHAVAGLFALFYDWENQLYRLLHAFGRSDEHMPYRWGGTINVLLPAAILLLGGLIAVARQVSRLGGHDRDSAAPGDPS